MMTPLVIILFYKINNKRVFQYLQNERNAEIRFHSSVER